MIKDLSSKSRRIQLKDAHQIAIGFGVVILLGAFLLCLPISSIDREWRSFFDSFYTSVGAVCVTGLSLIPLEECSAFGKIVIIALFQVGALGFMTITTLFMMIMRKKITLRNRIALQNALNTDSTKGMVRLVKNILISTFIIEFCGGLILLPYFCSVNGTAGIAQAFYHSISAFCNAGITLGQAIDSTYVLIITVILIILGGLGFMVIMDLLKNKFRFKKLSLHSKIALIATAVLLAFGCVSFLGFEYSNPLTLGGKTFGRKLLIAFFESANSRTAGFDIINQNGLSEGSKIIRDILIFIGASPGSMGGGIKTTTIAVLLLTIYSSLKARPYVTAAKHNLTQKTILKSVTIFVMGMLAVVVFMLIVMITESSSNFDVGTALQISISTLGTVGYHAPLIIKFSLAGKWATIVAMLVGRLGLLTTGLIFASDRPEPLVRYPDGNIILG